MPLRMLLLMLALVVVLVGCSQFGYYLQSARGQLDILAKRERIDELVAAPDTDPELRDRLRSVAAMREFASRELGLPDNDSYRSYVDLGRPYVVWNVFAAPEFSVQPRTWCFPLVGCISYRGYFREQRAQNYAARLREQGDDVYVAGIVAYSTLGHFSDPVLNSMLRGDDLYLAGVLFHELAHQVIYIRDATEFNEAFASLVEEVGVQRWLAAQGDTDSWLRWQQRQQRRAEFTALVTATRERLQTLYTDTLDVERRRQRKYQIISALRDAHEQLRAEIGEDTGYETWFAGPLNNAQLSSVATYRRLVPAFRALLAETGNDLDAFYAEVTRIGELPEEQRIATMEQWLQTAQSGLAVATAVSIEPATP